MRATMLPIAAVLFGAIGAGPALAGPVDVFVDVGHPSQQVVSRYLTGACLEDVNHEVYGGLYSQLIFGESFQEPAPGTPVAGFGAYGGSWTVVGGELTGGAGDGPKLVSSTTNMADGEVAVDVSLSSAAADGAGNAGLIVRVDGADLGADAFDGYEVSLDPTAHVVRLGRHRHDFRLLRDVPFDVPTDRWVRLAVRLSGATIGVEVDGKLVLTYHDGDRPPTGLGVGVRQWRRSARYRNLAVTTGGRRTDLPFVAGPADSGVSGTWAPVTSGSAALATSFDTDHPFVGRMSQVVSFTGGTGEVGIANAGLHGQGIAFAAGRPYDGYAWLRADRMTDVFAAAESGDGRRRHAETKVTVAGDGRWRRCDFALTPAATDAAGRFALRLKSPGSVAVGHAFLEPGDWGQFAGLPVRKDVVEAIRASGVGLLRYGGSMVNAPEYRWKKMVGPRDRRPPYAGHWYPYSTNGWAIPDFLNLCDAAGVVAVPDFNADETPADMADLVEYANGPAQTEWGRRRVADGHPKPYGLTRLEFGNEERVDDHYADRFEAVARAVWAKDPKMVLVVGDFQYERPITDPDHVAGADSRITSLAAHRRILDLARQVGGEVWFDVHVWTDGNGPSPSLRALPSYVDAIDKLAGGARHAVVVFELNADHPDQRRAIDNARAIGRIVTDGRLPVVCSANCLQVDRQNDNGWNQGLVFLNPTAVWTQPPAAVSKLFADGLQAHVLPVRVDGGDLEVTATGGDVGRPVVLHVVNPGDHPVAATLRLDGFTPSRPVVTVDELAGPAAATNTAAAPADIVPRRTQWRPTWTAGRADYTFPPRSVTALRVE